MTPTTGQAATVGEGCIPSPATVVLPLWAVMHILFDLFHTSAALLQKLLRPGAVAAACVLLLLTGCQDDDASAPVVVTEVIEFEGETLVITRVFTPTPELPTEEPALLIEPEQRFVELDVAVDTPFAPLDPQQAGTSLQDAVESLYVGLTNHNQQDNVIEPELALNWTVSPDGLTWTFNLRDDLYWVRPNAPATNLLSDVEQFDLVGVQRVRPVSAEDVVYAVRRACAPQTAAFNVFLLFIIDGCREVNGLDEADDAALARIGVRALSPTQVSFTLTEPASYFITLTTLPLLRPLPQDLIESDEINWLDPEQFVSSGPFVLLNLSETQQNLLLSDKPVGDPLRYQLLQRNPEWPLLFRGNVELVNLYNYGTRQEAFEVWQAEFLDITPLPVQQADAFLDPLNPRVLLALRQEAFYLGFNFDSPVFAVPELRRAFSAAIDRERLIEEVYGRNGSAARHFTPPGVLHGLPLDEVGVGYSPSFAQLQLADSGYGSCRLLGQIRYMVAASDIALQHAELLRQMWVENLGCDASQIEIEQVQFGTLLANTRPSAGPVRPDIYDLGWASFYPDAHNWFFDVLHCEMDNRPNRPCAPVDDVIRRAGVVFAPEERAQLYRQVENSFFRDDGSFPVAPLYVRGAYVLTKTWVEQLTPPTFGGAQFDTVLIDQEIKDLERSQ